MTFAALGLAVLGLLVALRALAGQGSWMRRVEEAERDARRRAEETASRLEQALEVERRLLARVAAGERVPREMILEGRLWGEVGPEEGRRLVEREDARLLDVRTASETAAGIIPGALLIPLDELEERLAELPRDGRTTLVYCAAGARSAAACELLSRAGIDGLVNLEGGFSSWTGARARPGG